MAEHNELGKWGEDEAASYLEDEGYAIIDRDWKIGRRDLDIVAMSPDGDTLVIVEEAVDKRKMRNLAVAANAYAKECKIDKNMRFDIISIIGKGHQVENLEHLKDAFNPMLIL